MGREQFDTNVDLVERYLDNWARWMRSHDSNLGYPKRASVALGGGQSVSGVFEEICDELDRTAARVMDCLVRDLPLHYQRAIDHRWLGCTIRVRQQEQYLTEAYTILELGINKRGLA